MGNDGVPIQYHIEVYEASFRNDPSLSWATSTPLPSLAVGDYFEATTYDRWSNPPKQGQAFRIKEINHIFWEIEKSHIGHKLMVCLETVSRPE
jgi:hypothetical protein